jgi:hypothetical protein
MNEDQQWGNNRGQKAGSNYPRQKQSGQKYNDNKNANYSPSTSYNYQNGKSRSNTRNVPRRRIDRFKRESMGSYDRLIKQNDIMIKLLKDIRDRLPVSPKPEKEAEKVNVEKQVQDAGQVEQVTEPTENSSEDSKEPVMESEEIKESVSGGEKPAKDTEEQVKAEAKPTEDTEEPTQENKEPSHEDNEQIPQTEESSKEEK